MESVRKKLEDEMEKIENSKVNGLMKLWLYQFYVLAHLAWPFMVQDFKRSFAESLQKSISTKLKKWAGLYRSADIGSLFRSRERFGLGLTSITMHFVRMQVIKCSLLKHPPDDDIRRLYLDLERREDTFRKRWVPTKQFKMAESQVEHNLRFPSQVGRQGLGAENFNPNPSLAERRKLIVASSLWLEREKLNSHSHGLALQGAWTRWEDQALCFDLSWKI